MSFDPKMRGLALSNSQTIRAAHNSMARQTLFEFDPKIAAKVNLSLIQNMKLFTFSNMINITFIIFDIILFVYYCRMKKFITLWCTCL